MAKIIGTVILIVSWLIAILVLLQHTGVYVGECDRGCKAVVDLPLSYAMAFAGFVFVTTQFVLFVSNRFLLFRRLALVGATVGCLSIVFQFSSNFFCELCCALDLCLVASWLSTKANKVLLSMAAVIALWGSISTLDALLKKSEIHQLGSHYLIRRSYERQPKISDRTVVVFSDPQCPYCKQLEQYLQKKHIAPVVHRWMLLPQFSPYSMQAAIAIETVSRIDPRIGSEYSYALYSEPGSLTPAIIKHVAGRLGVEHEVSDALSDPPADILLDIQSDGKQARELAILSTPAVYTATAGGFRVLREQLEFQSPEKITNGFLMSWLSGADSGK